MTSNMFSRRSFLAMSAMLPLSMRIKGFAMQGASIPVGLEMYSVRDEKQDAEATVRSVAQMGYEGLEFYGPYFEWSEAHAKEMRKLLDGLGIRCFSTHNDEANFGAKNITRMRDLNLILGSKYVVMSSSANKSKLDEWKTLAGALNAAADQLESSGLKVGIHNHQVEFTPLEGQRPIEVVAKNTKPSIMLQLDVGTCLEAGSNPVEWIKANPGRIKSIHCKEWLSQPNEGYHVLFGEGNADWKGIFRAAESVGGIEYYLVEQEGSRFPELETVKRCLDAFKAAHEAIK